MRTRTRNILVTATCAALSAIGWAAEPKFVVVGYQDGTQQVLPGDGKQFTDEQKQLLAKLFPQNPTIPVTPPPVVPTNTVTGIGTWQFNLDNKGWINYQVQSNAVHVCVDLVSGNDSGNGSVVQPVRTLKRASALFPAGRQTVLWLKGGQSFGVLPTIPSGPSPQNPNIVRAWGSSRAQVTYLIASGKNNLAFVDLQCKGSNTGKGNDNTGITLYKCNNVIIEGCEITGYRDGLVAQSDAKTRVHNLIIRRNVIHDQNAEPKNDVHSQGEYLYNWDGVLIEDNFYNCNGWRPNPNNPDKPLVNKTIFNHNDYKNAENWNVVSRNNLSANAAGTGWQDRCGGVNTYFVSIDNPIGASWGIVHGAGPGHPGGCSGEISHAIFQGGSNIGIEPRGVALVLGNIVKLDMKNVYFVDPWVTQNTSALQFERANRNDKAFKDDVGCNEVNLTNVYAVDWPKTIQYSTGIKKLTASHCWLPGTDQSAGRPTKIVTVDDYARAIGLKDAQDLAAKSMGQSRWSWDTRFEAKSIVTWVEANWGK